MPTSEKPLTEAEVITTVYGPPYQRGYDDGLQEGERRGWEAGKEAAAELAENEEEPAPGEMPPEIIGAVLAGDTVYVENAILAGVRSTKKCIAAAIRKLKKP